MDRARFAGRMVEALRRARRLHSERFSPQQRLHLAALLIATLWSVAASAQDISFNPAISDADFAKFSRVVAQGIFPTPVQAARATSLVGFDIGIAATGVKIDTSAAYWDYAVGSDFSTGGYLGVPRLVASKGLSFATVSASYAKVGSSDIKTYGGTFDFPIIRGTLATPEIAARASYGALTGVKDYDLRVYGIEGFISKGFGPVTPYGAVGIMRSDSNADIHQKLSPTTTVTTKKSDSSNVTRYTVGARFSLLVPKLAVEVTRAEETSYAAKISFGF